MKPEFITIEGTVYQYSPADGSYYPLPTEAQYRSQLWVIYLSLAISIVGLFFIL